jgi:hypothetical protein
MMKQSPYYTPSEIAAIARQIEGIKIYLGGAESAFRSALGHASSQETRAICGNWTADAHNNNVILSDSGMAAATDDSDDDDEEIYGVVFYGDCNSIHQDEDAAVVDNVKNTQTGEANHSSDEKSEMSEELIDFDETVSVDYAAKPCTDDPRSRSTKRGSDNMQLPSDCGTQRSEELLVFGSEINSVGYDLLPSNDNKNDSLQHGGNVTNNPPLRDGHKITSRAASSREDISHDHGITSTKPANSFKSDLTKDTSSNDNDSQDHRNIRQQYSNNNSVRPIETDDNEKLSSLRDKESPSPEIWHSRRSSLDVIKKRTQLKRDKAAASINKKYRRITSFGFDDEVENDGVSKRPKLMFMAAPGMKDKKKKQMTLMGMFKK